MQTLERALPLAGASNFRDLGGYRTHDGQAVRWRRLFRSDHLATLQAEDLRVLADLGVSRAFDFRGLEESALTHYSIPGVTRYALPIEPTVVQNLRALIDTGRALTSSDVVRLMQQTYRAFVSDNTPRFAELFGHLLASDVPSVFHCTAGKDRTGFAAALILLALGVDRATVMDDYLLTNALYRRPHLPGSDLPLELLQVIWRVQAEFLEAAIQVIDSDHHGIAKYLSNDLRLRPADLARLRALYLASPASS